MRHISDRQRNNPESILTGMLYTQLIHQSFHHPLTHSLIRHFSGDIMFKDISVIPPIVAFIIGVLCSLLGIGGGELMGPLLLILKVIPQVLAIFGH